MRKTPARECDRGSFVSTSANSARRGGDQPARGGARPGSIEGGHQMSFQHSSEPFTSNGNGTARPPVRGASLVHRKLTKSQLAVLVANIDDGVYPYQPTQSELAKALGVSVPMVQLAKRLSPLARQHVM